MDACISAISRHRIGVDGEGVTTLVVFMLCPLNCRYCLNPQTLSLNEAHKVYTPKTLYDELKIDNLYFMATGGGVTFGGGEPLLNAGFIREFRAVCGKDWKINLETSLNVPAAVLLSVLDVVDTYIIDIKDMNSIIYRSYTGKDNVQAVMNLKYLSANGYSDRCRIRVPLIPGYNTQRDVDASVASLRAMGYEDFDLFEYKTEIHGKR